MNTTEKRTEQAEAVERLREWLKPGDTVTTVMLHRSQSGMQRTIELMIAHDHSSDPCEVRSIAPWVARALGWTFDRDRGGIKVKGCGMDMGFHLVYTLSRVLFPDGFIPSQAGQYGRNGADKDALDTDGGYALRHRWL